MQKIEKMFGAAVRRRREDMGLSQEAFADVAGIHRTYVSSIELGKVQVSIGIAEQLAKALGVPLSRLWLDIERQGKLRRRERTANSTQRPSDLRASISPTRA